MEFGPGWLDDIGKGWKAELRDRPAHWHLRRLLQNIIDWQPVSVNVKLEGERSRGDFTVWFTIPNLPRSLTPWSLFPSGRSDDPTFRGRQGRCLKEMTAVLDMLEIQCSGGRFFIQPDAPEPLKRNHHVQVTDEVVIHGRSSLWRTSSMANAEAELFSIRTPPPVSLFVNTALVPRRQERERLRMSLETLVYEVDGVSRLREQETSIDLLEVRQGETPTLLELGFPLEQIKVPWHVDVLQRIPTDSKKEQAMPHWRRNLTVRLLMASAERMEGDRRG